MSRQYRKVILTVFVRSDSAPQVRRDLTDAANLIAADCDVYSFHIEVKRSGRPQNAADYEMDEDASRSTTTPR